MYTAVFLYVNNCISICTQVYFYTTYFYSTRVFLYHTSVFFSEQMYFNYKMYSYCKQVSLCNNVYIIIIMHTKSIINAALFSEVRVDVSEYQIQEYEMCTTVPWILGLHWTHLGTLPCSILDKFSENFQTGGGRVISDPKKFVAFFSW